MSKWNAKTVRVGQLKGAKLGITEVQNDGLKESVMITNQGTVAQPMNGWVLASLRGQSFYVFPEDLFLLPGTSIEIRSGQESASQTSGRESGTIDLHWTTDQIWNNQGDSAILFDAEGVEVGRYAYPHERVLRSSAKRCKKLVQGPDGYRIVDDSMYRKGRVTRRSKTQ